MFFQKKSHPEEENVAKKSVRKIDKVVTGMILGGIIASIYGVKKIKEKRDEENATHMIPHHEETEPSRQKRSILSRIFFGNK